MKTFSIILIIAMLALSGCQSIINRIAFHPDRSSVLSTEQLPNGIKEIAIKTEDDVVIQTLYLPAPGSDKALIFFHGNAGNIYHRIPELQLFNEMGLNVIGVDYRGYGNSAGKPSELGIYRDGKAVFEYVTTQLNFLKNNIVIFGRSIGTTVAITTAQFQDIAGMILVSPLTSAKAQAKTSSLRFISFLAGDAFDNLTKIRNIQAPLLIIHGTNDRVIPFSMGKELYERVNSEKHIVEIQGAGHNDIQTTFAQVYWDAVREFLKNIWVTT